MKTEYFILFFLIIFFNSCQNQTTDKHTDTYNSGLIKIAVDENFEPIIQQEIDVFEALNPKAVIDPIYTSEVDAINYLLKDTVRVAIATRPLSEKEVEYLQSKKFAPHSYKLATDAVALIANRSNIDTLITVNDFRRILVGDVTDWNQIYPGSKLGKIQLVFDNPNSSTVRYAIDSICGGKQLSKKLSAMKKNEDVVNFVSKNKNALGVIGVNWLGNKSDSTMLSFINNIRVMSVSSETKATVDNSYKPYQAYLFYGYYPFTRSVYVIINDPRGSLPTGFTSFMTAYKGQRIIYKTGLVPATQPVRIVNINN